VPTVEFFRRR